MCELLGMSANVPTDIRFSFAGLARRGGDTGPHVDGWGIAFYEGRGCRTFHDPEPSAKSDLARLLRAYPIKSRIVVAHVRRANRGRVALENTHPFTRELWGRPWSFAHNGQLTGVKKLPLKSFRPIGTTDSEHAFCWIMGELAERFAALPSPARLDAALPALFARLAQLGVFNVLMSDGRSLYAHCGKRLAVITRRAPFGRATLVDEDVQVDFSAETTPDDVVTVVATRALTRDEEWRDLQPGEVLILRDGGVRSVFGPAHAGRRTAGG
jgi:predicted glutamine amidotransferase